MAEPATDVPGRNVFENNKVYGSNAAIASGFTGKGAMGLYLNQRNNIVRRNVFYDNENFGILIDGNNGLGNSSVLSNRVYHNTLFNNGYREGYGDSSAGITITTFWVGGMEVSDNIFKNNIVSNNRRMALYVNNNGKGISGNQFIGNCFYHPHNPNSSIKIEPDGVARSLSYWQAHTSTSNMIKSNVEGDPVFANNNLSSLDLRLQSNSPCIDTGTALTTTRSQGSGMAVPVGDASYFMDGYGIEGVEGDTIQVGSEQVKVTRVDYATNTLTVDRSISWNQNTAVNLPYSGSGPDAGAFESGFNAPNPTPTPTAEPEPTPPPTTSTTPACSADLNQDGVVDLTDFLVLKLDFLKTTLQNQKSDINQDGLVDLSDYLLLRTSFLKTCSSSIPATATTTTPDPTPPALTSSDFSVSHFELINTSTGQVLQTFYPGNSYSVKTSSTHTIKAVTSLSAQSIRWTESNNYNTTVITRDDNSSPFTIICDGTWGYCPWDRGVGVYTIKAQAFSGANGSGESGPEVQVTVTVTQ